MSIAIFAVTSLTTEAQSLTVLRTGTGQALQTFIESLTGFAATNPAPLTFQFGFASQEIPTTNTFQSSFSVTLQGKSGSSTLLIATADPSGVAWAPPTPGGISVDPNSINRIATPFPTGLPTYTTWFAFDVSVAVPTQFWGQPANLYLDLFDDQSGQNSLGFFVLSSVPEPCASALCGLGVFLLLCSRTRGSSGCSSVRG